MNHEHSIIEITDKESEQVFSCKLQKRVVEKSKVFFKFSPLLDPVKYLTGKYKNIDISLLPNYENNTCNDKLLDVNNSAYIDSFFSYLTSCLLNKYKFVNAVDFYGSFLGIKTNFFYNIYDDIEYLYDSPFFNENKNILFNVAHIDEDLFENEASLKNKKKITIDDSNIKLDVDSFDDSVFENIFSSKPSTNKIIKNTELDLSNNLVFCDLKRKNSK